MLFVTFFFFINNIIRYRKVIEEMGVRTRVGRSRCVKGDVFSEVTDTVLVQLHQEASQTLPAHPNPRGWGLGDRD